MLGPHPVFVFFLVRFLVAAVVRAVLLWKGVYRTVFNKSCC